MRSIFRLERSGTGISANSNPAQIADSRDGRFYFLRPTVNFADSRCGAKRIAAASPQGLPLYKKHNGYARENRPTAHFPYGQSLYNPLRKNIPATPITRLLRRHTLCNIILQFSPDITPVFRPCHFGKIKTGTEKKNFTPLCRWTLKSSGRIFRAYRESAL